jgi:hypothetical protein
MTHSPIDRISLYVAVAGAILALGAFLVGGPVTGLGAAAGGAVAVLNFVALRFLLGRFVAAPDARKGGVMALLVMKLGVVGAICWFLIVGLGVDAVGFAVGLGALLLGIMMGSGRLIAAVSEEG